MRFSKIFASIVSTLILTTTACTQTEIYYVYQNPDGSVTQLPPGQVPMPQAPAQQAAAPAGQQQPVVQLANSQQPVQPQAGAPIAPQTAPNAKAPTNTAAKKGTAPVAGAPAAAPAAAGGSVEDKLLTKARDSFNALQSLTAMVSNFEQGNTGESGNGKLKISFKKPSSTKVEVIDSPDPGQKGVKLSFDSSGSVKVRPSGALSFASVTLQITDGKLLSGRKYQLNQIDLAATVTRLTKPGTKAKLTGQTTVSGAKVALLEITPQGHFDARITKEILGLDMQTFMPRIHEMYEGAKKVYGVEVTTLTPNAPVDLAV